jgi:hypothetical protein
VSVVRANWHLGDLELPSEAPVFIETVATPINLSASEAELEEELLETVATEARHFKMFLHPRTFEEGYVACDLKWEADHKLVGGSRHSCFTCPHFTDDELEPRASICALGRQQEGILVRLASLREHGTLDDELVEAFMRDEDAADELAEAMLCAGHTGT